MEHKQITNHHRNNKEGLAEMQGFYFALSPSDWINLHYIEVTPPDTYISVSKRMYFKLVSKVIDIPPHLV